MSYWYVGSPYSKYPLGIEEAFQAACRNVALLIKAGIPVYSPIAHTHSVAIHGEVDPFDHSIWLRADAPLMEAAHGLIVLKMSGWKKSYGLNWEISYFKNAGKPVIFMTPGVVPVNVYPKED